MAGILCFGPSKAAAQLEGSKSFTKEICAEAGIPTAASGSFEDLGSALAYLRQQGAPIVVKADGLAAGKGVTVCDTLEEAEDAVRDCFSGAFGASGSRVVIEERLVGEEASVFALSDGEHIVMLPSAQDHKRVWDGDRGPNTGGMGAYSPAPVMTEEMMARARREIVEPTIRRMAERGTPFSGVLFAGLMITADGPKLIEHNVRFGDPECQVLMMRLKSDALDLLEATARGQLAGFVPEFRDEAALTVVLATRGYPVSAVRGSLVKGAEDQDSDNLRVFQAATDRNGENLVANGGRVLNVTALGRLSPRRSREPTRRSTASTGPRASAGGTSAGGPWNGNRLEPLIKVAPVFYLVIVKHDPKARAEETIPIVERGSEFVRRIRGEAEEEPPIPSPEDGGPRIGVALGGGSARGLTHIPYIEAMDEMGLRPTVISGTSIGALIGSGWANGMTGAELREHSYEVLGTMRIIAGRLWGAQVRNLGNFFAKGFSVQLDAERVVEAFLPDGFPVEFKDLKIPFYVVATDFQSWHQAVFSAGPLRQAIAGSIAIPSLFKPVPFANHLLVDGGVVNPLPLDQAAADVDILVGVDVNGDPSDLLSRTQHNMIDVWFGSAQIMMHSLTAHMMAAYPPDVYVRPHLSVFGALEFWRVREIIEYVEKDKDNFKRQLARKVEAFITRSEDTSRALGNEM